MQGRCWKHASAGVKAPVKATAKARLAFNLCSETGCTTLAQTGMEGHCGKHASAEVKAKVKAKAKARRASAEVKAALKARLANYLCSETGCTTLAQSGMEGHCRKHASAEVKAKVKAKAKAKKEAAKVGAGSK
jgi:hypothetical protein